MSDERDIIHPLDSMENLLYIAIALAFVALAISIYVYLEAKGLKHKVTMLGHSLVKNLSRLRPPKANRSLPPSNGPQIIEDRAVPRAVSAVDDAVDDVDVVNTVDNISAVSAVSDVSAVSLSSQPLTPGTLKKFNLD